MKNLIDYKYGYVENTPYEYHYKNIDYRDTIVPLWYTLYNQYKDAVEISNTDIKQINLALCASIIQLGKLNKYNHDKNYYKIQDLEVEIKSIEKKIFMKQIDIKKKQIEILEKELSILNSKII